MTTSMAGERFTFDANVLVYTMDRAAGDKHRRAISIVDRAVERNCLLTVQALAEFFFVTTRKGMVSPAEATTQVADWLVMFPSVSASDAVLMAAMAAAARGRVAFWDAMLLATAEQAGCSILFSEDMQDGFKFGNLTVRNPLVGEELPADLESLLRS